MYRTETTAVVSLDTFIINSKPVTAATRDNNFKNPRRNTRDKTKKAKRNPQATLGYYSHQSVDGKKRNQLFFWGYRTHVIVSAEGVPLVEVTLPNNKTDAHVAKAAAILIKQPDKIRCFRTFAKDYQVDQVA